MKKIIFIILGVAILLGIGLFVASRFSQAPQPAPIATPTGTPSGPVQPPATSAWRNISAPQSVKLGKIPASAAIVFLGKDSYIYVMDKDGGNVTRITFGEKRDYEHTAVSFDRRYVVAGQVLGNDETGTPFEGLWLYDLQNGTEVRLLPNFFSAGNGGVVWDTKGFIYFHGQPKKIEGQLSPELVKKNNDSSDIWKVKYDGTGLQNLTNTPDSGKFDVSISNDGKLVVYARQFYDNLRSTPPYATIHNELWVMNSDGSNQRLVFKKGDGNIRTGGTFDPEFSDDDSKIVFSSVNTSVTPNYSSNASLNTAQDLWTVNIDGTGLTRVTAPGPINIIPAWQGHYILFSEISEKDGIIPWATATIRDDGTGFKVINRTGGFGRWIPRSGLLEKQ